MNKQIQISAYKEHLMDIFSLKAFRDVLGDNYLPTDYQKSELERFIIPVINKPASDVWRFDNRKISLAINRGFRILKVWESDYILNKNKTISETVNWLKQK